MCENVMRRPSSKGINLLLLTYVIGMNFRDSVFMVARQFYQQVNTEQETEITRPYMPQSDWFSFDYSGEKNAIKSHYIWTT